MPSLLCLLGSGMLSEDELAAQHGGAMIAVLTYMVLRVKAHCHCKSPL